MSDDLSHLTPVAEELLRVPQDQRIRAILGERWVHYNRAAQVLHIRKRRGGDIWRMTSVA